MIVGDSAWNTALAVAGQVQPLYSLEFPGVTSGGHPIVLTSYVPAAISGTPVWAKQAIHESLFSGSSQSVDELSGHSDISGMEIDCIDPTNLLKPIIASQGFLGAQALVKLGFVGLNYSDFTTMHTLQCRTPAITANGRIQFNLDDPLRYQVAKIFAWGGPNWWAPGLPTPQQPTGPSWNTNGQPISDKNPLWLQGRPIDILLAICQNYLGFGQTAGAPQTSWQMYEPGNISSLINPNPLIDVPTALSLQTDYFSGDWMEFKLTSAVPDAKSWLEREILQPLGLYFIVRATGELSLKYMHQPVTSVATIGQNQIVGIPMVETLDIVNVLTARLDTDNSTGSGTTASSTYNTTWPYWNQTSINAYQQQFMKQIESRGLISGAGGLSRMQLYSNRCFARHAFGAPTYKMKVTFSLIGLELGDGVTLTNPVMIDWQSGSVGMTSVLCEVLDRKPDYSRGTMQLTLLDTRFVETLTTPWLVSATSQTAWPGSGGNTDMFICPNSGTSTAPTAGNYSPGGQSPRVIY